MKRSIQEKLVQCTFNFELLNNQPVEEFTYKSTQPQDYPQAIWKIYRLSSKKDANTVYIGSAKFSLQVRLMHHKNEDKIFKWNIPKCNWILENYDDIDIIEISSANNKKEAIFSERAEILNYRKQGYNVLNIQTPGFHEKIENKQTSKEKGSNLSDITVWIG